MRSADLNLVPVMIFVTQAKSLINFVNVRPLLLLGRIGLRNAGPVEIPVQY